MPIFSIRWDAFSLMYDTMSHACVMRVVDVLVAMFVHCSHLERCRTRLSVTCSWLRSVTMQLFLKCQLCEPCPDKCRGGTNICILHKEEGCSHFDCGHYIPLRSFGLSCEHSVDAVPHYPAEKLDPWVQVREKDLIKFMYSESGEFETHGWQIALSHAPLS